MVYAFSKGSIKKINKQKKGGNFSTFLKS